MRPRCIAGGDNPSPVRLLIITVGALFTAEGIIMFLFFHLPPMSLLLESVLDSLLLVIIALPILYFLLFRPLVGHIADRNRAEGALRESESHFRLLYEQLPVPYQSLNSDGHIIDVNEAWLRVLGYCRDEVIGRWFGSFLSPGMADLFLERFSCFKAAGDVHGAEFDMVRKDGTIVTVTFEGRIGHDEQGGFRQTHCVFSDITERRRAERALREEMNKTEAIIAAMGNGISIQDAGYRIMYQNQVHRDIVGEHIGEYCYKAYEDRDSVCDGCPVTLAFRDGGVHTVERSASVEGKQVPVEITASPLKDAAGRIIAGIEIVRDVTERKRAEAHLQKDGERTRFLLDLYMRALHMDDDELYGYVLDEAVRLTDSSIGFLHRVSDDQKEIMLIAWNREARRNCTAAFDNHYPLDRAGNWADCVRIGRPVVYNDFALSPNRKGLPAGHTPVERFMSIPALEGDKVRIIFGVGNKAEDYDARDVENLQLVANELQKLLVHRGAEEKLREREEVLSSIFAQAADGIVLIDTETLRFAEFNVAAHRGLGYTHEEFASMRLPDIQAAGTPDELSARVRRMLASQADLDFEHQHRHKSGAVRDVYVSNRIVQVRGRDYFLGIWRDITEEKKADREKKRLEAELLQSQKMEAIGQLAGGVAHDFNNLLTGIIGYATISNERMHAGDPSRKYLKQILDLSERAAQLTHSLLAFSRRQVIAPKPVNINDIAGGMQKLLDRIIGEEIEFRADIAGHDLIVEADQGQIEQVLVNLAVNARDAMPHGGRLTMTTELFEMDDLFIQSHHFGEVGAYACVSVADTGTGMDEQVKERIFEPFFTTKAAGKGTGLGLAMVYGTIKQHDGFIDVYSEPGQGTVFKVFLPLVAAVTQPDEKEAPAPLPVGTETVLLVEDDDAVRAVARSLLKEFGYAVLEAGNGDSAVRLFGENRDAIRLVICDVIMPGQSGRKVYDALRGIDPRVKFLFMSGYTADMLSQRGIIREDINFISKPLRPEVFARKIREVLDK